MNDNVVPMPRADLAVLVANLMKTLRPKPGQPSINFVEALGALELVKIELWKEINAQDDGDGDGDGDTA